jgi:hypothetical protein
MNKLVTVIILILLTASIISITPIDAKGSMDKKSVEFIKDQYIIKIKKGKDIDNVKSKIVDILKKQDLDAKVNTYRKLDLLSIKINKPNIKDELKKVIDDIEYISNDIRIQAVAQTLPKGIDRIDADKRLPLGTGVNINGRAAILDTGIDSGHEDLNVSTTDFKDCIDINGNAEDHNGHGTHVAGIIGAKDNNIGVVGVAPNALLYKVKVLDNTGNGSLENLLCGIEWVTNNADKIDVANLSLTGYCPISDTDCIAIDNILEDAINNSINAGVVYVVAAGNDNSDVKNYIPARYANVITVSAIDDGNGKCDSPTNDQLAWFSNYGSMIDVAAPGVNIYSTWLGNTYKSLSGTSMATPHVSGAVLLYKSVNPSANVNEIISGVLSNSIPQTWPCNASKSNGYGGFTNDKDTFPEPLLYVAGNTWINDIDTKLIGEDVNCNAYTDLEHLVKKVKCELLDPSYNIHASKSTSTSSNEVIADCGNAGDCKVFVNTFSGSEAPNTPGNWKIKAIFYDVNNNIIAVKDKSIRIDSFLVLPETTIGAILIITSMLTLFVIYSIKTN